MAFGQQSGPPASARVVQELLGLLKEAGHEDFRDARGPMGFTQRQAAGKFTRDEADAFVDQLQQAAGDGSAEPTSPPPEPAEGNQLGRIPADRLAAELRRRGWSVTEP